MDGDTPAAAGTVTVDLAKIPVFPDETDESFDDSVWHVATAYAEALGVDPFDDDFEDLYKAALAVARELPGMSTVIAAAAATTLQDWCASGALLFPVDNFDEDQVQLASKDVAALIASLAISACASAIFCGIALQTGRHIETKTEAPVEFPLTVRTH